MRNLRALPQLALGWPSSLLFRKDLLHPAHLARFQPDLDSMGMDWGLRQDVLQDGSGELPWESTQASPASLPFPPLPT